MYRSYPSGRFFWVTPYCWASPVSSPIKAGPPWVIGSCALSSCASWAARRRCARDDRRPERRLQRRCTLDQLAGGDEPGRAGHDEEVEEGPGDLVMDRDC